MLKKVNNPANHGFLSFLFNTILRFFKHNVDAIGARNERPEQQLVLLIRLDVSEINQAEKTLKLSSNS